MKSLLKIKTPHSLHLKDYGTFFINVVPPNLLLYEYIVSPRPLKNEVKR